MTRCEHVPWMRFLNCCIDDRIANLQQWFSLSCLGCGAIAGPVAPLTGTNMQDARGARGLRLQHLLDHPKSQHDQHGKGHGGNLQPLLQLLTHGRAEEVQATGDQKTTTRTDQSPKPVSTSSRRHTGEKYRR